MVAVATHVSLSDSSTVSTVNAQQPYDSCNQTLKTNPDMGVDPRLLRTERNCWHAYACYATLVAQQPSARVTDN